MTKRIVSLLLCAVLLAGGVPAAAAAADSIGTAAFSDIADGEIAEAANALPVPQRRHTHPKVP